MNEIETFYGWIEDTEDALRVFELCRKGQLGRVRRRLHDEERQLIRSGSIFVFEEDESGMKRWTDGRLWSPSRILGHFLIYRELDKKRLFKDEKRKRSNSTGDLNSWNSSRADRKFSLMKSLMDEESQNNGSGKRDLMKGFEFKQNGLIKKTISITLGNRVHHMICYVSQAEFIAGFLKDPKGMEMTRALSKVPIPSDAILNQSFRKSSRRDRKLSCSFSSSHDSTSRSSEGEENVTHEHLLYYPTTDSIDLSFLDENSMPILVQDSTSTNLFSSDCYPASTSLSSSPLQMGLLQSTSYSKDTIQDSMTADCFQTEDLWVNPWSSNKA